MDSFINADSYSFNSLWDKQALTKVWKAIEGGCFKTSDGHRPDEVFIDADGDTCVSYPSRVDGGIRWNQKV
jgi:hypothetical protein